MILINTKFLLFSGVSFVALSMAITGPFVLVSLIDYTNSHFVDGGWDMEYRM